MQAPGQVQQQQQQQPRPPAPPGAQQYPPNQTGPRPPLPAQQQFQQPRPQNPNQAPPLRAPLPQQPPIQQQPTSRPPFPLPTQQPLNRPPLIRPQGQQQQPQMPGVPPGQQFRPAAPIGQQRPIGPPSRQLTNEFIGDQQQIRSQNSFDKPNSIDPSKIMTRPNSGLSNDDDDDVIMGRPQSSINRAPSDLQNAANYNKGPAVQRSDSKLSIPSRPPSATDHISKTPSPDIISKQLISENNLPKINETKNVYDPNSVQRPPSVTFRDNVVKQPYGSEPLKSPMNAVIDERALTPTSERFRTNSPNTMMPERPTSMINGNRGDQNLRSSMKYSKIIF